VIGGLYGGFFIPTEEPARVGAVAPSSSVSCAQLTKDEILQSAAAATRTAAAVFPCDRRALLRLFLTITQTPQNVTAFSPASARPYALALTS